MLRHNQNVQAKWAKGDELALQQREDKALIPELQKELEVMTKCERLEATAVHERESAELPNVEK